MSMRSQFRLAIVATVSAGVALLLQLFSLWLGLLFVLVLGDSWMGDVRHALIRFGLSSKFVTGYVSFALVELPLWSLVFVVGFFLGMVKRPWSTLLLVCIGLSLPLIGLIGDLIFVIYVINSPIEVPPPFDPFSLIFSLKMIGLRFCSILFVVAGWLLGTFLRGKGGSWRHPSPGPVPV